MRRNWWARMGVLVVVVLGAAACGGDDGSGSSSSGGDSDGESISEDDWREEASDLCGDWAEEVEDVDGTDPEEVAELAETTVQFGEDVDSLGPPEGIEDEVEELLDSIEALGEYTTEVAELTADGEFPDDELIAVGSEASTDLVDAAEATELDCDLSVIDERADDTGDLTDDFSDSSDDFSSDLSDDVEFTDALDPELFIPEFGEDPLLDELAVQCFDGVLESCDQLYFDSPISESTGSYEGYGATCGGRIADERSGQCVGLGG